MELFAIKGLNEYYVENIKEKIEADCNQIWRKNDRVGS